MLVVCGGRRPEAVPLNASCGLVRTRRNTEIFENTKKTSVRRRARTDSLRASSTPRMYVSWQLYGLNGNSTGIPSISSLGIVNHERFSIFQLPSLSSFVPKTGFPCGVSGVFYPRLVLSKCILSCSSQLFAVVMKHEHSTRMQFGIFFLICAAFHAADAFCLASFRMTAQTERFQAGSTRDKQDFAHISDALGNRPPTATATTAVARAEGMTRASLVNIMGAAVTVSLGVGASPPTAAAARSTEELVSFFVSFVFCILPRNKQQCLRKLDSS